MNIITERLVIRRFERSDWEDLFEYLSDEEVVKFEPYHVFSEEQAKEESIRRSERKDFFAVCLKETGKVIGNLYLGKSELDTWELGYVFNRNYQGKGYATESAKALMDKMFKEEKARRIIAMCNPKNEPSWHLMERLHMRREGFLLQNVYFKTNDLGEPIWLDTYEYAILKTEWEQLQR